MSYQKKNFADFHFVRFFYAFLVWFSNVMLITVGRVSSKKIQQQLNKQTNKIFGRCDMSTAVITIPVGPTRRKQPQGGLIIWQRACCRISHVNTSSRYLVFLIKTGRQMLTLHYWTKPRKHSYIKQNENLQIGLFLDMRWNIISHENVTIGTSN